MFMDISNINYSEFFLDILECVGKPIHSLLSGVKAENINNMKNFEISRNKPNRQYL